MKNLFFAFVSCVLIAACNNSGSGARTERDDTVSGNTDNDYDKTQDGTTTGNGNNTNTGSGEMNDMDREFVMKAAMGNTAEVEAGRLAQQKGSAAGVKDFGAQMVRDHSDAQSKLKAAAGSMASVPDSVDKAHADMKRKLEGLSGTQFDREYIAAQIRDHQETIALFERQVSGGQNSSLVEFARTTLPHLKMHLEAVQGLAKNNNQ